MSRTYEEIELFALAYDSGFHERRMGRSPMHLAPTVQAFFDHRNTRHRLSSLEVESTLRGEVPVTFALWRKFSQAVSECRQGGRFPLVLSGNCRATAGAIAGLGAEDLAVIWSGQRLSAARRAERRRRARHGSRAHQGLAASGHDYRGVRFGARSGAVRPPCRTGASGGSVAVTLARIQYCGSNGAHSHSKLPGNES
ncbi:hypothetical protein BH24PSE2_BH24PSE2_07030 [soil metagenome]